MEKEEEEEEEEGGELADEEYLQQPMSFAGAQHHQNHRIYLTHPNLLPTPRLDTS